MLLIDDDETIRAIAARSLRQAGYNVLVPSGPEDALQLASIAAAGRVVQRMQFLQVAHLFESWRKHIMATSKGPGTQENQAGGAQPQATQAQPQGAAAQQPTAPAQQGAPTQATTAIAPREDRGLARGGLPMFGPFSLMRRLFDDMEQLWGGAGRQPLELALAPFVPAVDVDRRGDRIIARVDLPGMAADDVTVTITDNALIVEGERRVEARERGVYERAYGSFRRVIPLPENTEAESAEARFENGVLEISVRAPERRERGRNVQINKPGEQARTSREAH